MQKYRTLLATSTLVAIAAAGLFATLSAAAVADPPRIVGTWSSKTTPERLIFKSNGYVRSCYGNGARGNAAMGSWTQPQPGRYKIEFTHAISASCAGEPTLLHAYRIAISGAAAIQDAELALFVSGEFPPDRYVRTGD